MNLNLKENLAAGYKSSSQIARIVTESWATENLYCPACPSNSLSPFPINTRAVDLQCTECNRAFQLKGSLAWNQYKIVDSAYGSMIEAIRSDRVPNLVLMQYTRQWKVSNVLIVPSWEYPKLS